MKDKWNNTYCFLHDKRSANTILFDFSEAINYMFTVCCYIFIKIMVSGLNLICLLCLKSNNISHVKKMQYLCICLFVQLYL